MAVLMRANAARMPGAHLRTPITAEEVRASKPIADPCGSSIAARSPTAGRPSSSSGGTRPGRAPGSGVRRRRIPTST